MTPRPTTPSPPGVDGNYVAEWFGHRVWPGVDVSRAAVKNQSECLCPFLSLATAAPTLCAARFTRLQVAAAARKLIQPPETH